MESLFFLKKKKEALRSKSRRDRQSTTLIQLHGPGLEAWRAPSFLKIEKEETAVRTMRKTMTWTVVTGIRLEAVPAAGADYAKRFLVELPRSVARWGYLAEQLIY